MKRLRGLLPLLVVALLVYLPLGGWKLLYGGEDDSATRSYGAEYNVPGFEWTVVLNPHGVPTEDTRIGFFDQCLLRYRGSVREVTSHYSLYTALSRDTLVEYRAPVGSPARGTLCPDGAVFLLPKAELAQFNGRFAERERYEQQLAAEVEDAISAPRPGPAYTVEETIHWVEAANPEGLESFGYHIPFLDACGIEAGGTVQAIQQISEGTLYAYTPEPGQSFRGIGIPCPPNTVFLRDALRPRYF
jgi:hypothetical protein